MALKTFAFYNPTTDTWSKGNRPTFRHDFGALVCDEEKLYVIGGYNQDCAEEYDLDTEEWSLCNFNVPKKLENLYAVTVAM